MPSKEFVLLCESSAKKAIKEMNLPLGKILKERKKLFEEELRKNKIFSKDLRKEKVFDLCSYSIFKIASKYLKTKKRKIEFTQLVGKNSYLWIKRKEKIKEKGSADEITKIKRVMAKVIRFLERAGYVSSAKMDWSSFSERDWRKKGKAKISYIMFNPAILPSAKRLYNEEGFAQHYSSRILEAAFLDFNIEGREEKSFNPNKFERKVTEVWEIRKK